MMKKILLSGLLSSTMLFALQPSVEELTRSVEPSQSCEDATLIGSTLPYVFGPDDGIPMNMNAYYDMNLQATTYHNGTLYGYGWVSFEVPVKSTVRIWTTSYDVLEPNAYRWVGLFDSKCTGRAIATTNYAPSVGVRSGRDEFKMVLEAGTYKLAIHEKALYFFPRYRTQITYTPVEGYQPYKEHVGGKTSNDALLLNAYPSVFTLHLTHAFSWKGKAQRYGWYSFDIAEDTHSVIEFTASESGGSWIGIYNENGTKVADKWTAKGTTGLIDVDLPEGHYKFFINKSGDDIGNVRIHITQ